MLATTRYDEPILQSIIEEKELKKELENVDCHTAFMFENNISLTNLSSRKSHKPAKQDIPQIFKFSNLSKSNVDEEILGETTDKVNYCTYNK